MANQGFSYGTRRNCPKPKKACSKPNMSDFKPFNPNKRPSRKALAGKTSHWMTDEEIEHQKQTNALPKEVRFEMRRMQLGRGEFAQQSDTDSDGYGSDGDIEGRYIENESRDESGKEDTTPIADSNTSLALVQEFGETMEEIMVATKQLCCEKPKGGLNGKTANAKTKGRRVEDGSEDSEEERPLQAVSTVHWKRGKVAKPWQRGSRFRDEGGC